MPTYQAPAVYIEETPSAPVILPVGTSTAAFIGTAPKADAFPATARAVNSWTQFVRDYLPEKDAASTPLSHAVYGFFLNGGSRCYVVNVPAGKPIARHRKERGGLEMLEDLGAEIVCGPGKAEAGAIDGP